MTQNAKLKALFGRYFSGASTADENAELAQLIQQADTDTLSQLLSASWENLNAAEAVIPSAHADLILKMILGKMDEGNTLSESAENAGSQALPPLAIKYPYSQRNEERRSPQKRSGWWKYAAAAAVLLLLASAAYYYFSGEPATPPSYVKKALPADISPGQEGAILTLANGKKILLESAGEGLVTRQGGIEVVNDNGKLKYVAAQGSAETLMYNTMRTPKGRQYQLVLSDGTKVWLNAASSITYPAVFVGKERKVKITGEAYFEVKSLNRPLVSKGKQVKEAVVGSSSESGDKVPFIVQFDTPSGEGKIEVLGTHFNVNAYPDESSINTTLLKGSVKVTAGAKSSMLKPGQQAQIAISSLEGGIASSGPTEGMQVISDVNTEEVVAWKNGYFSFNGATVEAIMRQVTRWYDAEIVYEGNVRNERFSGSVPRSATASKLLEVLELTRTVRFSIEDRKIIVKPF